MKTKETPDKKLHVRKKVAGGATGAVLGAMVGGPLGAVVGGVIGTAMGRAAETGKLQKFAANYPRSARKVTTKVARKTRTTRKQLKAAGGRIKRAASLPRRRSRSVRARRR
jgi:hypothetical protein